MIRGQPSLLEIVKSIIENNMAVCTADSKGIDRDPAQAGRGPRRWFKRELKPPFCCRDLRIDFLEIDVWGDDSILKDKNRLDDATRLLAVFQQSFNTQMINLRCSACRALQMTKAGLTSPNIQRREIPWPS
jgi:hypothetical protein